MRFSKFGQFLTQGAGIVQLMEDLGEAQTAKGPVYMLGGGNPGNIPQVEDYFRSQMEALTHTPERFDAMLGAYDSPEGEPLFREALANLLNSTLGWQVSRDNIAIANGSQSSFFTLFNLFAGEYDDGTRRKILLPLTPEYIGYADAGLGESLFISHRPSIELLDDNLFKYHIDLSTLTPDEQIGAVCVSRPTNPTGNVLTDSEIESLREYCREQDIPLIIDNAYGTPFPNIIFTEATPVWDDNIICCMSLSKLGMPGVRTGIVVAAPEVIEAMSGSNAILSLAPGSFGPVLMTDAMKTGEVLELANQYVRPFYQAKVEKTLKLIRHHLDGLPYRVHEPEGAIFLWIWFEGLPITSDQLYRRLKQQGVYVIAGEHFFPGLEDSDWPHRYECIRLSYAGDEAVVERGVEILAGVIRDVYAHA